MSKRKEKLIYISMVMTLLTVDVSGVVNYILATDLEEEGQSELIEGINVPKPDEYNIEDESKLEEEPEEEYPIIEEVSKIEGDSIEEEDSKSEDETIAEEEDRIEPRQIEMFSDRTENNYVLATDNDFTEVSSGRYRYIGTEEYVEVPHVIHGQPITSYRDMFANTSVKGVKSTNKNVTNMQGMFQMLQSDTLDISQLDTSNVTDMSSMFYRSRATELDVSGLNTSKVTNMTSMFRESWASRLDVSNFDTSNVTTMAYMFTLTKEEELDLRNFDTSNVTTMAYMFSSTLATKIDIRGFDTRKVQSMRNMFHEFKGKSLDISSLNTTNVQNMEGMFRNTNLESIDVSRFDTTKVTGMNIMFEGFKGDVLDLSSFTFGEGTITTNMFRGSNLKLVLAKPEYIERLMGVEGNPQETVFGKGLVGLIRYNSSNTNGEVTLEFEAYAPRGTNVTRVRTPDGKWVNGSKITYQVKHNGGYEFQAEDSKGNRETFTVRIGNIDNYLPKVIAVKDKEGWTSTINVVVVATDIGSGVENIKIDGEEVDSDKVNFTFKLEEPLRGIGERRDEIFKDKDGKWKIKRQIEEVIFDGTNVEFNGTNEEGWSISDRYNTEKYTQYVYTGEDYIHGNGMLSTHFEEVPNVWFEDKLGISDGGTYAEVLKLWVKMPKDLATDEEDFENWLKSENRKGTPFKVYLVRQTPIIEELSKEQQDIMDLVQRNTTGEVKVYGESVNTEEPRVDKPTKVKSMEEVNLEVDMGTITLSEPLRSINNYKDRIYQKEGKWYLEKNIEEVEIGDNEGSRIFESTAYSINGYTMMVYEETGTTYEHKRGLMTTHFNEKDSVWLKDETGVSDDGTSRKMLQIWFKVPDTVAKDTREFKEWLNGEKEKGTPLTAYYVRPTPLVTEITGELKDKLDVIQSQLPIPLTIEGESRQQDEPKMTEPKSVEGLRSIKLGVLDVQENGTYNVVVKDFAGNIIEENIKIDNLDNTAPEVKVFPEDADWMNADREVAIRATDKGSGIEKIEYAWSNRKDTPTKFSVYENDLLLRDEGVWYFHYRVTDKSGNITSGYTGEYKIDKTRPNLNLKPDTTQWTNKGVNITATGQDEASGINYVELNQEYKDVNLVSLDDVFNFMSEDLIIGENSIKFTGNDTLSGIGIPYTLVEKGKEYVLSYDIRSLEGIIETYRGHLTLSDSAELYIDGERVKGEMLHPYQSSGLGKDIEDDGEFHKVDIKFNTKRMVDGTSQDNNIYIQPNRSRQVPYTAEIKNLQLVEGTEVLPYTPNSRDLIEKSNPLNLTFMENGTYEFKAMDNAGNSITDSITIRNIDRIKPSATVTGNPTTWDSRDEIEITVIAEDKESGVKRITLPNKNEVVGNNTTYKVSENGNYVFLIEDKAGNEETITVEVDKLMIPYYFYIYDNKGEPVKGAEFELLRNGDRYRESESDGDGLVDFGKVPPVGNYTIRQIKAPDGHIVNPDEIEVDVDDETDPIEIISYPRGAEMPSTGTMDYITYGAIIVVLLGLIIVYNRKRNE